MIWSIPLCYNVCCQKKIRNPKQALGCTSRGFYDAYIYHSQMT